MTALLIVLAVLLLFGLLPAGVRLRYEDGDLEVRLKLGPFRVLLMPVKPLSGEKLARQHGKRVRASLEKQKKKARDKARKKKEKEAEKRKSKAQREQERLAKKKLPVGELMPLVRLALEAAGRLPRKLAVNELFLHIVCGGKDAAKAAIGYGRVCAAVGTALPVFGEELADSCRRDVGVGLDYERESMGIYARLDVHMLVGTAVLLAFGTGFRFLKLLITNKLKHKVEEKEV